jgi:hypothetical protein
VGGEGRSHCGERGGRLGRCCSSRRWFRRDSSRRCFGSCVCGVCMLSVYEALRFWRMRVHATAFAGSHHLLQLCCSSVAALLRRRCRFAIYSSRRCVGSCARVHANANATRLASSQHTASSLVCMCGSSRRCCGSCVCVHNVC